MDSQSSVWRLLANNQYRPLFFTQFFGAFNDNAFKLAMLTMISFYLNQSESQSQFYQALAGGLFTIPFFLLSATSGQLADCYNKAIMTRWVKLFECGLMAVGAIALYTGNIYLLMSILTGLGIHSTFFGPIKYAILPELLSKKKLLGGTALIEASTFLAILLGTTMGALTVGHQSVILAIVLTNLVAWVGLLTSWFIPTSLHREKSLKIDWNPIRATYQLLAYTFKQTFITVVILAISWFWFIGSVILIKLPDYVRFVLLANNQVFALFLVMFSIGIALGSLAVNRLLKGRVSLRWVPLSLLFISLFAFDLYFLSPSKLGHLTSHALQSLPDFVASAMNWRIMIDFFALCFCGGLFVVPLYTLLQTQSDISHRSRVIAANNIINAAFMVLGSFFVMILLKVNISIQGVFLILALINLIAVICLWLKKANLPAV